MTQVINILIPFLSFILTYNKVKAHYIFVLCLTPISKTWRLYETSWAMHMPFKLWHIMTLILCVLFYYNCFFIWTMVIIDQPMVVEDDDLFYGLIISLVMMQSCPPWRTSCNYIISMVVNATSINWKPFSLVHKSCNVIFLCLLFVCQAFGIMRS
jgi:hypothetical protein